MENFKSFITEQKDEKYKVVVISNELGDKAITAERMESEARELNYPSYVTSMEGTYTRFQNGQRTIHKGDDETGFKIHPSDTVSKNDKITIGKKIIRLNEIIKLWKLYKPIKYICSNKDELNRKKIFDLIPDNFPRTISIGRLDFMSEGLILLTLPNCFLS